MRIGVSSAVCPESGLEEFLDEAAGAGFAGVELRGLKGYPHLHLMPELIEDPSRVRGWLDARHLQLVGLVCPATLDAKSPGDIRQATELVTQYLELARALGAAGVSVALGRVQPWDNRRFTMGRMAARVRELAAVAMELQVELFVENGGDFLTSADLWFVADAAGVSAVRCGWHQMLALSVRERPTRSLPRMGRQLALAHLCDGSFAEDRRIATYRPLGEGDAEVVHQIHLLRGLTFDGYLVWNRPSLTWHEWPSPVGVFPSIVSFLKQQIEARDEPLAAYKGDKRPTKFVERLISVADEA